MQEKYPNISSYAYTTNNPLKYVDPDGKDIIVLRNSKGAGTMGHGAILIGSEKKGWTYISKDGYAGSSFDSQSKYIVQEFKSLDEFVNSPHNLLLQEGTHSDTDGTGASPYLLEVDKDYKVIQRYDKGLYIRTTQKDGSSTDSNAIDAGTETAKNNYQLGRSDCSDVVTSALNVSKNSENKQVKNGETSFPAGGLYHERPNTKFNSIENRNPDAVRIDEQLVPKSFKNEN